MEAYLDNSATTVVLDEVADIVVETMKNDYGNPSSMHMRGLQAEHYVKDSKDRIAKVLKVDAKEIVFTSGGTESNNLAIIGGALANRRMGMHVITTKVEHASVHNPMEYLEELGFEVTYIGVDKDGVILVEDLVNAIREDTILVSVMYVNNEIGSLMPIERIGTAIKEKNSKTLFHVDAIQAFGKYEIYPRRYKIDMLSVSGHKIHGPKGSGFLYIKDKVKVKPQILGGGQQKGMRSGTENVPAIAGIGVASAWMYQNLEENTKKLYEMKDYLIDELEKMDGVVVHSKKGHVSAPHVVNASFLGVRSEVLLHALEERNVYVSAGSACSSNKRSVSATLTAIGLDQAQMESSVRFSFSVFTTKEELMYAIEVLGELLPKLKLFVRK